MTVIRDVIRDVIRPVLRNVIRDSTGGGGIVPGETPTWFYVGPTFTTYTEELPFQLDMNPYVATPEGEPITAWSATGGATISSTPGPDFGILNFTNVAGEYPVTVTATNINGSASSNEFTIIVIQGAVPELPIWSTVPDYYSVSGIEEGNRIPAAAAEVGVLSANGEGVDMHEFITNHPTPWPVTPGSWSVSPGNVATIDANGILKGDANTSPGQYFLTVTCSNANGPATSGIFSWTVVSQDGYVVDFDKATIHPALNGLTHTRGATQTFLNHLADPTATVSGDTAALVGQDWNGSTYVERSVGYGISMEKGLNTLSAPFGVLPGMELEACGHIIFRLERLPGAGEGYRYFTLGNDDPSDYNELYLSGGASANTFVLGVRTLVGNAVEVTTPVLTLAVGDFIDLRYKVNGTETDKLTLWYSINGSTETPVTGQSYPVEVQAKAVDRLTFCSNYTDVASTDNTAVIMHARAVPTGYLDNAVITGWSDWVHPTPIIIEQPNDLILGEEPIKPVEIVTDLPDTSYGVQGDYIQLSITVTGEAPITYGWEVNTGSGFVPVLDAYPQSTSTTTNSPRIGPLGAGSLDIKCIVDNAAKQPKTTTTTSVQLVQPPVSSDQYVLLFSDLIDGKHNGWHTDANKGAAVTLWGAGFGTDASAITIGFTDSDTTYDLAGADYIVEVGPDPFNPMLERLTFHLSATVPVGDYGITLTIGGAETEPLSFHVRNTGRFIFLDYENGDDNRSTNDGSFELPYKSQLGVCSDQWMLAGDHYYLRGNMVYPGNNSYQNSFYIFSSRSVTGEKDNGISWTTYPGEKEAELNTGAQTRDNRVYCVDGFEDKHCHVWSKMDMYGIHASMNIGKGNDTRVIGVRGNGVQDYFSGAGDFGWSGANKGNNNIKLLGVVSRGGRTGNRLDHAIYPGGGGSLYPGTEIAYCYFYDNHYRVGPLISYNYKTNSTTDDTRVKAGEWVREQTCHHNYIDMRTPDPEGESEGFYTCRAIVNNGMGNDRNGGAEAVNFTQSEPLHIYNNLIISDVRDGIPGTPGDGTGGDNRQSGALEMRGFGGVTVVRNNTIIDAPPVGGLCDAGTPSTVPDDPRPVDHRYWYNNVVTTSGEGSYAGNVPYEGFGATFTSYNNYYAGRDDAQAKYLNYAYGEEAPQDRDYADAAALGITVTPGDYQTYRTVTVASDSPLKGQGSANANPGGSRDFYHVPYNKDGTPRYDAGAIQAESLPEGTAFLAFSDFTDISTQPWSTADESVGGVLTVWGKNLGTTRGSSYIMVGDVALDDDKYYPVAEPWGESGKPVPFLQRITFHVPASLPPGQNVIRVVVGGQQSNALDINVHDVPYVFASVAVAEGNGTGTYEDPISPYRLSRDVLTVAGMGVYFFGGVYSDYFDDGQGVFYHRHPKDNGHHGASGKAMKYGVVPGADVFLTDTSGESGSENVKNAITCGATYVQFAKFRADVPRRCGDYGQETRYVGNDFIGLRRSDTSGTGIVVPKGRWSKTLGNLLHGGRSRYQQDHVVYVSEDKSNIHMDNVDEVGGGEVAWNYLYDNSFHDGGHFIRNMQGDDRINDGAVCHGMHWHHNYVDATTTDPLATRAMGHAMVLGNTGQSMDVDGNTRITLGKDRVHNNILVGPTVPLDNTWMLNIYSPDADIYNNAIIGWPTGNTGAGGISIGRTQDERLQGTINWFNNILVANDSSNIYITEYSGGGTMNGQGNVYWGSTSTAYCGNESNPTLADPGLIIDVENGLFTLPEGSPAIGLGSTLTEDQETDINGERYAGRIDSGPVQYVEGA